MIYFDHNATTPLDDRVLQAMLPFLSHLYGNPSSLYKIARISRSAIELAREQVAQLVNARPEQVIFTSGGTEANNLALKGGRPHAKIVSSVVEHPSVLEATQAELVGVDAQGYIDKQALVLMNQPFDLASFMLVNNETGVIQELAELTELMHARGIVVHTDAVQAVGKMAVDFQALGVDLMSLSGHKIYGPKGSGALIAKSELIQNPLLTGGGQESGYRSGTENVAAIVGLGKAAELAYTELEQRRQHCLQLRVYLEQQLNALPNVSIFAEHSRRIVNTVQFGVQNCVGEMLLMQLDQCNIAVSSGSACASDKAAASHVLTAMGVDNELALSAVRVSFGVHNTRQEIELFIKSLSQLIN